MDSRGNGGNGRYKNDRRGRGDTKGTLLASRMSSGSGSGPVNSGSSGSYRSSNSADNRSSDN